MLPDCRASWTSSSAGKLFSSLDSILPILNADGLWPQLYHSSSSVRKRYHVSGNGCTDCLTVWCCLPCAQQQAARELGREEHHLAHAYAQQMQFGPAPGGAHGVMAPPVPVQSYSGGTGQVYAVEGQAHDGGAKSGAGGVLPSYRY